MEKIKAVVVDDNKDNVNLLVKFLNNYCSSYVSVVGTANNIKDANILIEFFKPELLLLDTVLGNDKAFDLLEQIQPYNYKVIFVSAKDNYAVKAYKYNTIDYILKPVKLGELISAVNRACDDIKLKMLTDKNQIENVPASLNLHKFDSSIIVIPSIDKIVLQPTEDILYCKSEGRCTIFNLVDNKKITSSKNLGEYERTLNPNAFFRTHNSFIVNLNHVLNINKKAGNYCEISNNEMLPIAKRRQDELYRFLGLK